MSINGVSVGGKKKKLYPLAIFKAYEYRAVQQKRNDVCLCRHKSQLFLWDSLDPEDLVVFTGLDTAGPRDHKELIPSCYCEVLLKYLSVQCLTFGFFYTL